MTVSTQDDPFHQPRRDYMDALRLASGHFSECDDLAQELDEPYFESLDWLGILLKDWANPHLAAPVSAAYHVARPDTVDLIRYRHESDGVEITIQESAVFVYTELVGDGVASADLARAATEFGRLFDAPEKIAFRYVDGEAGLFSSAPTHGLVEMDTWLERIDGYIISGSAVAYMIYKVHLNYDCMCRNPSAWFADSLRKRP